MLRANLLTAELDHILDAAGFSHRGAALGDRLGARRIGAGLYVAVSGAAIWPYHYHRGVEEWLLVLSGSPVLREPAGRRTLAAGDLVAFPSGPTGAHTVEGPGRLVILSAGVDDASGGTSVYPDSGKLDVAEGMVLLDTVAGYWHREGTGELDIELQPREPLALETRAHPRPLVNVLSAPVAPLFDDLPAGYRSRGRVLGPRLGAEMLGATVLELDPGEGSAPYHYEWGREEWVLVLSGAPTLRHPDGETLLEVADAVWFLEGPAGAHRLINRGDALARVLLVSTTGTPSNVSYPDSGKWFLRNGPEAGVMLREDGPVDYWDGER